MQRYAHKRVTYFDPHTFIIIILFFLKKGYGFIRFNNMESAMGAISAENGAQWGAKVLSVSLAKQKGQNQY